MKLVVIALVAVTLALAAAGGVAFALQRSAIIASVDRALENAAERLTGAEGQTDSGDDKTDVVQNTLDPASYGTTASYLQAVLERTVPGTRSVGIGIVNGEIVMRSPSKATAELAKDHAFVQQIVAETTATKRAVSGTVSADGADYRYLALPVAVHDDAPGIYVRALNLTDYLQPIIAGAVVYAAISAGALIVLGIGLWFVVGRLVVSPTEELHRAKREYLEERTRAEQAAEPEVVATPQSPVAAYDQLDRSESAFDVQRKLLDDVRHELKTPITIVRGHLEMMDVEDPNDVAATREIGMSELDRMTRMVEDIDLLATVQDDEYTMGVVSIAHVTERLAELVVMIPGHPWHVEQRAAASVRGNPDRLLQAWLALAENAAKYTPAGSPIEVGSSLQGDQVQLWVQDHGPGIPPAMRHRIFRRFDRGGGRRDVGGSGLGLAIVDAITRAHGGSCTVTDTPGGGATFRISLPVRPGSGDGSMPAPVRAGDVLQQREDTT